MKSPYVRVSFPRHSVDGRATNLCKDLLIVDLYDPSLWEPAHAEATETATDALELLPE
jgi:hypothetical protein